MAINYGRSTDGSNADNGSTWALANLDLTGCVADVTAGDTVFVSQAHAESTTGAVTLTFPGTPAAPMKVICASDAAEPPTAVADTATVTATSNIIVNGSAHFYGIRFRPGSGGSVTQSFLSGTTATCNQFYDNCAIELLTTGTGLAKIGFGDETRTDSNRYVYRNSDIKFGGVNHRIKVASEFTWEGGGFMSGGASPVNVFELGTRGVGVFMVRNVDFSANIGTAFNLVLQPPGGNAVLARFSQIKLPASWSGALFSGAPPAPGIKAEVTNSLIGTAKLRYWTHEYAGEVRDETTIVRTGGFTDDGDLVSIKMTSTANAEYPTIPLKGAPIFFNVATSGSPITKYVDIVHDSQGAGTAGALRNDEIALEVSGSGGFASNMKADFLATASDHATSTETWTTTGLTTPVKQRMAITFTPDSAGEYVLTPVLMVASKTVYVCPKAT